ncbi:hypothetical protein HQ40_02960 [Porphyromonas gulae]|nr:hypothetical protein HQ40_02960 [Porphyromonas gulae]
MLEPVGECQLICCLENANGKCSDCGLRILKNRRENFFVVARKIFTFRTKTKNFSSHVLRTVE